MAFKGAAHDLRGSLPTRADRLRHGLECRGAAVSDPGERIFSDSFDYGGQVRPPRQKRPKVSGPVASERATQIAIIARLHIHGVFCAHIPNAGKRGAATGARLKQEGMRPGFPDLFCAANARTALLEVKAENGRLSPAQIECHEDLRRRGIRVWVVYNQDDAVRACREAGVLR